MSPLCLCPLGRMALRAHLETFPVCMFVPGIPLEQPMQYEVLSTPHDFFFSSFFLWRSVFCFVFVPLPSSLCMESVEKPPELYGPGA